MGDAAEEHKACSIERPGDHRRPLDRARAPRRLRGPPPLRRLPARPRHRPPGAGRPPPPPRRGRRARATPVLRAPAPVRVPPHADGRRPLAGAGRPDALGRPLVERWRRPAHRARPRPVRPRARPDLRVLGLRADVRAHGHPAAAPDPVRRLPPEGDDVRDPHELLATPLPELLAAARDVRDRAHGTAGHLLAEGLHPADDAVPRRCGYCTFAQPPARLAAPYLTPDEVLAIAPPARAPAATRRCSRSASGPSCATPWPAEWLAATATTRPSTTSRPWRQLVLDETGLLPHANAGALDADELAAAAGVAVAGDDARVARRPTSACHRGAPDKTPAPAPRHARGRRAADIPFTTGILVGIGETRADRLEALEAIADAARATATCRR